MKFKALADDAYWYGVYKSTVRPLLLEYVESTEKIKWDDALLQAIDFVVDRLFGPEEEKAE